MYTYTYKYTYGMCLCELVCTQKADFGWKNHVHSAENHHFGQNFYEVLQKTSAKEPGAMLKTASKSDDGDEQITACILFNFGQNSCFSQDSRVLKREPTAVVKTSKHCNRIA